VPEKEGDELCDSMDHCESVPPIAEHWPKMLLPEYETCATLTAAKCTDLHSDKRKG
jgi:hypothetical protein